MINELLKVVKDYDEALASIKEFYVSGNTTNNTKNHINIQRGDIFVQLYDDNSYLGTAYIMPDIIDVRIGGNESNKVVFVDFADGTTEKSVLNKADVFSLEQGISICITKKLLSNQCGYDDSGSSIYNKIIKRALKIYNQKAEEMQKETEKKKTDENKLAKLRAKKEARKLKHFNEERERQIEIQKEAYLRAMREYNNSTETEANK